MNPIASYREQIVDAVVYNQCTIVVGETGSGKTTELPLMLYEEIDLEGGKIGITQPRRLAAVSTAQFVAGKLSECVGETVGSRVRLDSNVGPETEVKFLTDGMLLAELMSDPLLSEYSIIMLDEFHERSPIIDLLIGKLKWLCEQRPEFRIVIASATLNVDELRAYLPDAAQFLICFKVVRPSKDMTPTANCCGTYGYFAHCLLIFEPSAGECITICVHLVLHVCIRKPHLDADAVFA